MLAFPSLADNSRSRYVTFFYLYFMQGVPSGFALTALANYLTTNGTSSSTVGTFITIIGLPWIVQMVWGPLIDKYRYSIVGEYKHWIVLTQFAAVAASLVLLVVQNPAQQVWLLASVFFVHSTVASVQDASVDAMAILITPTNEKGRVNAFMRGGIILGISFGAAALSFVLHKWGFTTAVFVQSGILLLFTMFFFFTRLHRTDSLLPRVIKKSLPAVIENDVSLASIFRRLVNAIFHGKAFRIFGVIGLSYLCFSVFTRSINFYLIRNLSWSDSELSILTGGWGALVTLTVILLSGLFADKFGATRLQRYVLLGLSLFLLLFNGLLFETSSRTFITVGLLFWGIADPLYSIAAFPILMNLSNKEIAGSQFTAYMALINLADIGGAYISGWLLLFVKGPYLGVIAGAILLTITIILFRYKSQLDPDKGTRSDLSILP